MGNTAFIALGSNIGNRYDYLSEAIEHLAKHPKIKLVNTSSVYETDPVGYEEQDLFLNMVAEIQTDMSAFELLDFCLKVELELGRKREIVWGPRTIDLDILLYNQENIKSEKLIIPHPRMLERNFVMIPLSEIRTDIIIPNLEKPLEAWIKELPNKEGVRIWKRKNGEDVFEPIGS
ncbi:2-amino-4-hydroxy-6-hydroxymethyldihydropteridine diphosphokinase [Neobacillus sp. DY30]|uniref:2-amino-4-hydroxy-6- hydroxymethyldihydropteridine diphosphokinase n=1 Tax=Neobacillus sp. DY30 TaxID=3047871 RepID=UPI0024C098F4|nr:2-amino-4-hydroxy-6-hydroxymethyldihydropteridine diphosphokinase [Neobacillus sp. DY30]WHY00834.1 2-amino-4-hydroxy-6-hydroxymethyldihydropteridine diphosphokinase [Neobacillus sp. DY30]